MSSNPEFESHQALLKHLIRQLTEEELPFYESSAGLNYWAWHITAGVAFLASVISAFLAAYIDQAQYQAFGKTLLIIVPIIGAAATGILHLYKFREKEALREEGRIELEDTIANAKSFAVNGATPDEYRKAYHQVLECANALAKSQHRRDIALRSNEIPKIKPNV